MKRFRPAAFLIPSNSGELKFGLYIDSQIPRNSMVFLLRSHFSKLLIFHQNKAGMTDFNMPWCTFRFQTSKINVLSLPWIIFRCWKTAHFSTSEPPIFCHQPSKILKTFFVPFNFEVFLLYIVLQPLTRKKNNPKWIYIFLLWWQK